jgi:sensor histidine kinase YesM
MLISYLFFSKIADRRFSPLKCWLIGMLCFECAAAANLLSANTVWINLISFCLANLAFAVLCFHMKPGVAVFYSFILTAIMSALEIISIFFISALHRSDTTNYNSDVILLVLDITISKILYFLTCHILTNFIVSGKDKHRFPLGLYAYPASIFVCLTIFWYICAQQALSYINQCLLAIVSMILFGSTVILFITYQHSLERENEYVQVKREVERLQTEKSYYDILEHQNQQLRIYAHDAKNHLAAIQNLNTDPRVSSYIEKLSGQLNSYANHCHSGNQILDVIISKYAAACELKDIHFEYDVRLCNLGGIDDFDLVAILGNLLDNALTAAEQSQQSELSVATALRNSYCVIVIENSCDTAPILRGNRLVTTKENGGLHGCGLKSVARTLKKYQGDFDWEYNSTSHRFITTVMLKQQTMNHE